MLAERAVEERVRRARIDDDLVLDAGILDPALVGLDVVGGDVLVGPAEEAEDRAARLGGACDRVRRALAARDERGVEAHGAVEVELEIDGGITLETAPLAVAAGVDILVAGTAIFGRPDPRAAARELRAVASAASAST